MPKSNDSTPPQARTPTVAGYSQGLLYTHREGLYDLLMPSSAVESTVLSFEDARRAVEHHASRITAPATENVPLLDAAHRILAEPVHADRDIPPFRRSTRDGFAVCAAGLAQIPARLKLIGEIKAGPDHNPRAIQPGETYSIMTGAPVPDGADAVVMVEYSSQSEGIVEIRKAIEPGENMVPQGAEAACGMLLLGRGTRLNEAAIALAASVGKSSLQVFARPRVAILSTGDEIVDIEAQPGPAQIRNSNSYSLAVQIREAGGEPLILPIAPDEPLRLRELIDEGLESDLLIMTGGVSMGRHDIVEPVLSQLHAEFFFTGARIQPGRPVVFGGIRRAARAPASKPDLSRLPDALDSRHKYFFGLPGNPASTMVTFELFARPIVEALSGMKPGSLTFLHARLKSRIHVKPGLTRFLPALLSGEFGETRVELVRWHGSGDIAAQSRSNCYVVIPPDRGSIPGGDWIAVLLR